jgi:hypothetical protein
MFATETKAQNTGFEYIEKNTGSGTKLGVTNTKTGREVLPPVYDNILDYTDGRFIVMKAGKLGVVDTMNKLLVPIIYDETVGFMGDRAFAAKNKKWAMLDGSGKPLTGFVFDKILGYQDGVARVEIAGKIGYIDNSGKYILACKFTEGYDCWGDFILVYEKSFISTGYQYVTKNRQGEEINRQDIGYSGKLPIVFNKKGQIVYRGEQYEKVLYNNGKSIFVVKSGDAQQKIVDAQGNELVPYASGWKFVNTDDWIAIETPTAYGIIGLDGQILWTPSFTYVSDYEFRSGELAKATFNNGQSIYIDKKAKCVEYDGIKCPE